MFTDENFNNIVSAFKAYDEVDAVVLAGSRATKHNDEMSDYDLYVYYTKELTEQQKEAVILPQCCRAEVMNHYWESESNCVMNNGTPIDIIYRDINMMGRFFGGKLEDFKGMNGYSTAFIHNIATSFVLFDKSGAFTKLQRRLNEPYPDSLSRNIITRNRKLLSGVLPSYDKQIKKAFDRGDIVSVHHRTTEFLSSYFDIIFALNKVTHPGEKRQIELAKKLCNILPENFEENVHKLLTTIPDNDPSEIIADMVQKLDKIL